METKKRLIHRECVFFLVTRLGLEPRTPTLKV